MALMKCKECGKEISSKAEFCPHCGFVYKKGKGTKKVVFTTIITVFSIIIVLILTIVLFVLFEKTRDARNTKKYYGTWELVSGDYSDSNVSFIDEMVIDEKNVESQTNVGGYLSTHSQKYAVRKIDKTNKLFIFTEVQNIASDNNCVCFVLDGDYLTQFFEDDCVGTTNYNLKFKRK